MLEHIDPTISTEDFIDFDIEVSTPHGRLKTADIIASITGIQYKKLELKVNAEDYKKHTRSTAEQVRSAITVLKGLSIFSKFVEEWFQSQHQEIL